MDFGLKDRIALVTGASSGLGHACARTLVDEGARVCITGSDADRIAAAATQLGPGVDGSVLDLTEPRHPEAAVAHVTATCGAPPTILVMSTGGPPAGTFDSTDDAQWERATDLILRGAVRTIRACLPGMRAAGHGRIVLITSIAAQEPIEGLLTSSTLRAGLHGFVNALAREIGALGITANAVMPGYTRTNRLIELADRWAEQRGTTREGVLESLAAGTPIGRIAEPAELAAAVAFLCSEQAAAINGVALPVDGGELRSI
ncbi:MAG: short-chain dehydrogenase [Planctomycetes bacterium]|nr:short-chain dehydrogenase [Planctomycetota bacterium]